MRLGERAEQKVQVMSSGSLALDIALGAGGYLRGVLLKFMVESSGKTTVALHAVAQAQKKVELLPLLMPNMHLILLMQLHWVLILMNCFYHNQILESKDLRLQEN